MNKCFFKRVGIFRARISGIINAKLFPNYIDKMLLSFVKEFLNYRTYSCKSRSSVLVETCY